MVDLGFILNVSGLLGTVVKVQLTKWAPFTAQIPYRSVLLLS